MARPGLDRSAPTAAAATVLALATTGAPEVGIRPDVAHRGLHRVGLLGLALAARLRAGTGVLVGRAAEAGHDALGAGGKAPVKGLLQRVGDAQRDVVVVVVPAGLALVTRLVWLLAWVALIALELARLATTPTTTTELALTLALPRCLPGPCCPWPGPRPPCWPPWPPPC